MACGCRPRPPDVKTSVANTLGTWKHTIVFAYKAIRYGRRSELPERRSAGYRTWKDRRKTGGEPASKRLVIGHPATLPDARFPTDPDSALCRPETGMGSKTASVNKVRERVAYLCNPFPDRTFTRSTASILSGRSRRALPARSRSLLRILKVCRGPNGRLRPFEKQRRTMRQTSRKQHVALHRERVAFGRPVPPARMRLPAPGPDAAARTCCGASVRRSAARVRLSGPPA